MIWFAELDTHTHTNVRAMHACAAITIAMVTVLMRANVNGDLDRVNANVHGEPP